MIKIYIAGPITPTGEGNHAIEFLNNVRNGLKIAVSLIKCGFAPFCPMLDFQYFLISGGITEYDIKSLSLEWLRSCDVVYLLGGAENSEGCKTECIVAKANNIPIFTSLSELINTYKERL